MVLRKTWVLGNIGSDIESVFDGSRSLVFLRFLRLEVSNFCRWVSESRIYHFIFPFGLRSRIFQSS